MWHHFTYLTARFAAVTKRNVHWVALKHRLNTWTLAHFYYVDIGTYCCIFMKLLQKRNAAGSEFIYPGSVPKNECSIVLEICPTPNPSLNIPDSVNKCKTDAKTYNCAILHYLYADLNCFVKPWSHWTWTGAPRLVSTSPYSVSYWTNLPSMKTHRYKAGDVRC